MIPLFNAVSLPLKYSGNPGVKRRILQGRCACQPTDVPICDLGPQIDDIQFKKIMSYIETGKAEGAQCLLGGNRLGSKGFFVQPTIFSVSERVFPDTHPSL